MLAHYVERIGPEIKYIKGPDNGAADDLSGITLINSDVKESSITRENITESYFAKKLDSDTFPLKHQTIYKHQRKEKIC